MIPALIVGSFLAFTVALNIEVITVKGSSMNPTYSSEEEDRIMTVRRPFLFPIPTFIGEKINRLSEKLNKFNTLDRGDIVVIKINDKLIIKRIIGIPGDSIFINKNFISINGEKIIRECTKKQGIYNEILRKSGKYKKYKVILNAYENTEMRLVLGPKEYFYMGDNRIASVDSRTKGVCKIESIVKKKIFDVFNHKLKTLLNRILMLKVLTVLS